MYKKRFTEWGLEKNYKASEKEAVILFEEACRENGRRMPQMTIRSKPIKIDRIHRFSVQKRNMQRSTGFVARPSLKKIANLGTNLENSTTATVDVMDLVAASAMHLAPRRDRNRQALTNAPERLLSTLSVESILVRARIYADWQIQYKPRQLWPQNELNVDFFERLDCARLFLEVYPWLALVLVRRAIWRKIWLVPGRQSFSEICTWNLRSLFGTVLEACDSKP